MSAPELGPHRQQRRWADGIISEAEFQAKKKQILGI